MRVPVLAVFRTVLLVGLLAAFCAAGYAAYKNIPRILDELAPPPDAKEVPAGRKVIVQVPKGASLSKVGAILEKQGVISSRLVFKLVAMIRGEQRKIKAGEYELETGSDAGAVLDQLISGKTLMFSVTVPEGYNIYQVAQVFDQHKIIPREEFIKLATDKSLLEELGVEGESLEGYLFPDTYFFRPSELTDGKTIIRLMVKRFNEVYDTHVGTLAEKAGWSRRQVITLASLIEKEARAAEHGLVSAVFHNRLRKRMRLQSDPTVIYGIKPMGSKITRADLNNPHAYNTYQHRGLPPGPIANPGKASLVAAVQPADADYLYFVAKNDGTHEFSKTLKEHNRWVNLYQRSRRGPSGPRPPDSHARQ